MKTDTVRTVALLALSSLGMLYGGQAMAQEKYMGEVFLMGSNFCPRGSMPAHGQILALTSNTALFSLLGRTYGGDGVTTFALPDLRGRSPIGAGQGGGLAPVEFGEVAGAATSTLLLANMPTHTHQITPSLQIPASTEPATHTIPGPDRVPAQTMNAGGYIAASEADTTLGATTVSTASMTGGSQPFSIRDPYLAMTWCIVTEGIFPSRN